MKIAKFVVVVWLFKTFMTYGGAVEFLNTLTPDQQSAAKITSDRYSVCLIYPEASK